MTELFVFGLTTREAIEAKFGPHEAKLAELEKASHLAISKVFQDDSGVES